MTPPEQTIPVQLLHKSYSSDQLLHECPRRWQLYRLNITDIDAETGEDSVQNITFAFGHAVGLGIQLVLSGATEETWLLELFKTWPLDLDVVDEKARKSFYYAIYAVQKFAAQYSQGTLLDGFKLCYLPTATGSMRPAVEVGFKIIFPDGFVYRGHIDAILVHEETGMVMVLEDKTTKYKVVNPAQYKNSPQATGYSLILDLIFGELSSYQVTYLVYKTTELEYEQFPFTKTHTQRAMWIQEQLLDIQMIKLYSEQNYFPMRGEFCINKYGRECKFLNICHMSTERLVISHALDVKEDTREYDYIFDLRQLLESQLNATALGE